jgi:hypothetical protein
MAGRSWRSPGGASTRRGVSRSVPQTRARARAPAQRRRRRRWQRLARTQRRRDSRARIRCSAIFRFPVVVVATDTPRPHKRNALRKVPMRNQTALNGFPRPPEPGDAPKRQPGARARHGTIGRSAGLPGTSLLGFVFEPALSHETACILNAGDRQAHVDITSFRRPRARRPVSDYCRGAHRICPTTSRVRRRSARYRLFIGVQTCRSSQHMRVTWHAEVSSYRRSRMQRLTTTKHSPAIAPQVTQTLCKRLFVLAPVNGCSKIWNKS